MGMEDLVARIGRPMASSAQPSIVSRPDEINLSCESRFWAACNYTRTHKHTHRYTMSISVSIVSAALGSAGRRQ